MIHLDALDIFTERFVTCVYEPLRVTFNLVPNTQIVSYDPIHFDGLLARAVVEMATEGKLLEDAEDGYWIPLPLKMLWQSEAGFPLWSASVLYPIGPVADDIYVRHKRNSDGWLHDKKKLITRNGPWMERRLPTPTRVCDTYEARCIGNKDAVENLLSVFTHIGKLRLGRIRSVQVDICDFSDEDMWLDGSKFIKPMPAESEIVKMWPCAPLPVGWTPPFWKPSLFSLGWRTGILLIDDLDFFDDIEKITKSCIA